VPDGLWQRIEPLLPMIERRYRNPGREQINDRKAPLESHMFNEQA
jgi:hypothetical protein